MTNYIMCFGACLATMYYSEYGLRHVFCLNRHNLELIARTAKAEVRQSSILYATDCAALDYSKNFYSKSRRPSTCGLSWLWIL